MELVHEHIRDDHLKQWSLEKNDPSSLTDLRLQLWKQLKALPMPNLKYSLGVGTRLDSLTLLELPKQYESTFIESNESIVSIGEQAIIKAKDYLFSLLNPEENRLTALHVALLTSVTLIEIPENTHCKKPIVLSTKLQSSWNADHIIIIAHPNSKATVIDHTTSDTNNAWRTHGVEIIALDGSDITYAGTQNIDESVTQIAYHHAKTRKDAKVTWIEGNFGTGQLIARTVTDLSGEGSHVNMHELFYSYRNQNFDLEGVIHHRVPNTTSDLFARGVVTGSSKAIYRGLIKIHKNATNSKGHQREDTLLLSNKAESDAIPVLEIDNDDVQCSHSATVGKIDPELLFYMQSRGMTIIDAKKMMIAGFFEPLFDKLHHEKIHAELRKLIEIRMDEK